MSVNDTHTNAFLLECSRLYVISQMFIQFEMMNALNAGGLEEVTSWGRCNAPQCVNLLKTLDELIYLEMKKALFVFMLRSKEAEAKLVLKLHRVTLHLINLSFTVITCKP